MVRAIQRHDQLTKHKLLYQYDRIEPTEMRLLFLKPAVNRDMNLVMSIETFKDKEVGAKDGQQEFEALSYFWGPGPADKPVFLEGPPPKVDFGDMAALSVHVPDFKSGTRFYVRPNLDKALRYLRHKSQTVVLWVDAICINQRDEEIEKPAQIAKMKTIYNKAVNVCIWLHDGKGAGQEDRSRDFHAAMNFSQEIIRISEIENLAQDETKTELWSDLLDLMRCSWFSRRWVIQELALARDATVHCGEHNVPWQEFADAIGLFDLNFNRIRPLFGKSQIPRVFRNYRNFTALEPLGAKVLVDAITNTFRKSVDETIYEPVSDLETLVSSLSSFESSDPRDTIYALLNIAKESMYSETPATEIGPPKPKYSKDILKVYTDFLEWVVCSTKSLDIICRQWAIPERTKPGGRKNPTPLIQLPSWIQTVTKSSWGFQEQGFNGRMNGDSIVGKAGRTRYNASRSGRPEVQFGRRTRPNSPKPNPTRANWAPVAGKLPCGAMNGHSHRLYVRGIEIDAITWTQGPVVRGVITSACLKKGGWKTDRGDLVKVPDKLWRTLVADRDPEGENPPPWYHRAALHFMTLADNLGHIATIELLDHEITPDGKLPYIVAEYLKRVQAVTWNRKFLEGTQQVNDQDPLFGLGPPDTERNDRICILFGCSVPVILRPCNNGTDHYHFIGEAYIHGMMDGEAVIMLGEEELKAKTKEFVIL
ncbi:hypothetical protein K469DRAFT_737786 [Zopfia rhizophila CBS 207.26]|uniref:Heterokaryon incompatibility domain-containing protein n=1 Tax=Zopfia rhizophila CBS 207.26 TaxID=1314779 RepID=A0A6A6E961_9PEZI|nr:hypothetical protein K469DRAFT_737786 [Zopfia rhizophila CBS 207.26]